MFHKTLPDLVKGLRAHKKDEKQFISQCLKEIKEELKETDNDKKVEALRKLSYVRDPYNRVQTHSVCLHSYICSGSILVGPHSRLSRR